MSPAEKKPGRDHLERLIADVERHAGEALRKESDSVTERFAARTEARHIEELALRDARQLAHEFVLYKESLQTQISALQTSLMLLQQSKPSPIGWIVITVVCTALAMALLLK